MEQQNLQNNDEIEIDVLELFHVLLDKIWVIILAGAVAALAVVAATILFITPQYQSTTKMYVLSKQDSNTLTSQDMQTSLSLTKDYAELIKSRTVTEGVITQLNLDMTHEQLFKQNDSRFCNRYPNPFNFRDVMQIHMWHVRLPMRSVMWQQTILRM